MHGRGGYGGGSHGFGAGGGHPGGPHGGFAGHRGGGFGGPPRHHRGIGGGIFGFFAPPPPRGYFRQGPPPPPLMGYGYHHPHVCTGVFVGPGIAAASLSPHVYYAPRNTTACIPSAPPNSTDVHYYYVDVPENVYPGEVFRVSVSGREMLVTCPAVSGPGERVTIAVESDPVPIIATAVPVSSAVAGDATFVAATTPVQR